ncbi:GntR family transcriptional regulator [Acuticoccus sp. I52.16.1]|uniref:GntR family transcriptional regulator n=1 Tax=Acuticoccus sp. I52.16.1 TaxID=2928472 RepID=UPI001FD5B9FD|nr:FCD domain-containing protein [Acuticoccus sp. I52.16.1]UOM34512.1 FCD domain-containing protein [Acuticoccus sp. I52.16.1]
MSRSEHAFQTLREAILGGRFEPGAPLKYSELQELCGVSVSPVREAMTRLVAAGLVEGEHNRGYRAASLSLAELDDLVRTRVEIESLALTRAIAFGDAHWEAAAVSGLHVIEVLPRRQADDPSLHNEEWEVHHIAFHRALIAACTSPLLLQFSHMLSDRADRYRRFSLTLEAPDRDVAAEHRAILDATLARDGAKACRLLAEHYRNTARYVREALAANEA